LAKKFSSEITLFALIIALFGWFGIKPESFKTIFFTLIPDWIFRLAILAIIIWTIYLTFKIKKLLRTDISMLGEEFRKHKVENDNVEKDLRKKIGGLRDIINDIYSQKKEQKKNVKIEMTEEVEFILEKIAGEASQVILYRDLESEFRKEFEKKRSDFNILMNQLKQYNLCYDTEAGAFGEMAFGITPSGLEYLGSIR
jgi:hypothetical protein